MFWIILTKDTADTAHWCCEQNICWIEWKSVNGFAMVTLADNDRQARSLEDVSVLILNRGEGELIKAPNSLCKRVRKGDVRLLVHMGNQNDPPSEDNWNALWVALESEHTGLKCLKDIPVNARMDFGSVRNPSIQSELAPTVRNAIKYAGNLKLDVLLTEKWGKAATAAASTNELMQVEALFPIYLLLTNPMQEGSVEVIRTALEIALGKLLPRSGLMSAAVDLKQQVLDPDKVTNFLGEFKKASGRVTDPVRDDANQS